MIIIIDLIKIMCEANVDIYIYIYIYIYVPLFRCSHFSVSFATSRKISLKLCTLAKKDIIKQFRYTNLFRPVSTRCHLQGAHIYMLIWNIQVWLYWAEISVSKKRK